MAIVYTVGAVGTLAFLWRIPGYLPAKIVWSAAWPLLWSVLLGKYIVKGDV